MCVSEILMFPFTGSASCNESFKPFKPLGVFPKPGYLDCSVNPAGMITIVLQTVGPFRRPVRGHKMIAFLYVMYFFQGNFFSKDL